MKEIYDKNNRYKKSNSKYTKALDKHVQMEMMAVGPRLIGRRVAQIFLEKMACFQQVLHGWGGGGGRRKERENEGRLDGRGKYDITGRGR